MLSISLEHLLGVAGIVYFLVNTDAGGIFRNTLGRLPLVGRVFGCPFCCGFWVSLVLFNAVNHYLMLDTGMYYPFDKASMESYLTSILFAFAGAIMSLLLDRVILGHETTFRMSSMLNPSQPDEVSEE